MLAPASIAALLCIASVMAKVRMARGQRLGITPLRIGIAAGGSLLALNVFMSDAIHALLAGPVEWDSLRPTPFKWPLFLIAIAMMAVPTLAATWPTSNTACAQPLAGYNQEQGEHTASNHQTVRPAAAPDAGPPSPAAPTT